MNYIKNIKPQNFTYKQTISSKVFLIKNQIMSYIHKSKLKTTK